MAHYGTRVGVAELHRSNLDCPKIGGDPAGSPPGPLDSISRPVSRVLSARAKRPRLTAIPLRRRLPGALSNLPGRRDPDIDPEDRSARAEASLAPSLFGLAPGGVCRAACVAARAVRSYRTVSPLPLSHPVGWGRGGLFSVALSLGSRPPDVIRHRMPMEPGLSSQVRLSASARAAARPPDWQAMGSALADVKGLGGWPNED